MPDFTRRKFLWLIGGTTAYLSLPAPRPLRSPVPIATSPLIGELGEYKGIRFVLRDLDGSYVFAKQNSLHRVTPITTEQYWARRLYDDVTQELKYGKFLPAKL